jgi:hypothetical protein
MRRPAAIILMRVMAKKCEATRFDLLTRVIENYEQKYWPIDPPDRTAG